ncbi:pantoate--beta-alanine ligase [Motilibacter peucedani]|uniref:Pantothenate synthetase n=1 Tax=Motilibacter peucedani TaxID=598650 RepID=A0A420XPR1_9ACTN|nr:pantoate--beta-alanine ligase [Motilibacter peucedani]RKS75258.1 pantoate--beta-alanine ligase [Motilibacter peucedani]
MTALVHETAALRTSLEGRGPLAVVMTMGALHAGHAALVRAARARVGDTGTVVVTVFVNPLQFGPGEDFERYPRTLDDDLEVCRREGVDVVFAPSAAEVYPREPVVRVDPGPPGSDLEGASRPGHFAGVLTVVLKLMNLVRPQLAFFGEKDWQQLSLVTAMATDLSLGVEVVGVPTVREPDGLALSSRNRYLSADERAAALALSRALQAGAAQGARGSEAVLAAGREVLAGASGVRVDYLELRGPGFSADPRGGEARLLVAARVGTTRLIDNVPVRLGSAA